MGYIYFAKHVGVDGVKIGMTTKDDVKDRIKSMETFSPSGVDLLGSIYSPNAQDLEKQLHKDFQDFRMHGEFFNIHPSEIYSIIDDYRYQKNEVLVYFYPKNSIGKIMITRIENLRNVFIDLGHLVYLHEELINTDSIDIIKDIANKYGFRHMNVIACTDYYDLKELQTLFSNDPYTK
jgi:hypothetical protein